MKLFYTIDSGYGGYNDLKHKWNVISKVNIDSNPVLGLEFPLWVIVLFWRC